MDLGGAVAMRRVLKLGRTGAFGEGCVEVEVIVVGDCGGDCCSDGNPNSTASSNFWGEARKTRSCRRADGSV